MSNWYVGQKVVCVDDVPRYHPPSALQKGLIYTVERITWGGLGLMLTELKSPWSNNGDFWSDRFRPLDPLEEQIERIESEGCPEPELQEA